MARIERILTTVRQEAVTPKLTRVCKAHETNDNVETKTTGTQTEIETKKAETETKTKTETAETAEKPMTAEKAETAKEAEMATSCCCSHFFVKRKTLNQIEMV